MTINEKNQANERYIAQASENSNDSIGAISFDFYANNIQEAVLTANAYADKDLGGWIVYSLQKVW